MMKNKNLGTKEWASTNVNIYSGCSHNCRYCYAKKIAIRFKRKVEDNWNIMELNQKAYMHTYKHRKGIIMFPTSHDITPETLDKNINTIANLIRANNRILIVSKPHFGCIKEICDEFQKFIDQIEFRFTIGTNDNRSLRFWEPNTPTFEERFACVKHAHDHGFKVSVSMEPLLIRNPQKVIDLVSPYVATIWLGKMNGYCLTKPKYFILGEYNYYCEQQIINSNDNFHKLKVQYANNPLIKFKNGL